MVGQIDLKLLKLNKTKRGYGIKPIGKEGRGTNKLEAVHTLNEQDLDHYSVIFSQSQFEDSYAVIYDPVYKKVNSINRGWTEDTIGSMTVVFDSDEFELSDITEIAIQG